MEARDDRRITSTDQRRRDLTHRPPEKGAAVHADDLSAHREGGVLADESGTEWTVTYDALVVGEGRWLERVDGRNALRFAFRTGSDETRVMGAE